MYVRIKLHKYSDIVIEITEQYILVQRLTYYINNFKGLKENT